MLVVFTATLLASYQRPTLPVNATGDWLLRPDPRSSSPVRLEQLDVTTIAMTNGLISRVFAISPFFATWDIQTSQGSAIRALADEATVTLDGRTYTVGGGHPLMADGSACPLPRGVGPADNCPTAYFNRSTAYGPNVSSFQYASHWTSAPTAPFPWKQARHAPDVPWPPLGLRLNVNLTAPRGCDPNHSQVVVTIHYEMYQGIPAMSKWLTVTNPGQRATGDTVAPPSHTDGDADAGHGHQSHRHHDHRRHSHSTSVGLPPDQIGPICIQPCDAALPPSNWESRWTVAPDVVGPIKMHSSGQALCLSLVAGHAAHEYNDLLDVLECDSKNSLQDWLFESTTGLLKTAATAAAVMALLGTQGVQKLPCSVYPDTNPPSINTSDCAIDINNNQADPGTVLGVDANYHDSPIAPHWELAYGAGASAGGSSGEVKISSAHYKDRCLWHTPIPLPPPPPPPPKPKPACVAPACIVLTTATVEILRVNSPWAPAGPSADWAVDPRNSGGSGTPSTGGTPPHVNRAGSMLPAGYGLLYPRLTQGHGTLASWGLDPTFEGDYSDNDGAVQPQFTAGYDDVGTYTPTLRYGGPAARLRAPGAGNDAGNDRNNPFESFRVITLYGDSTDNERAGLGVRKLTRLLAPQTSEAPLFMHLTDTSPAGVRSAVDQIVATGGGFDMIVFSFGSGFNIESTDPAYWREVQTSVAYANARGIEIGGYDLIALSRTGTGFDAIDPATGNSAGSTCFASGWNRGLLATVLHFINVTGISMIETDGPYGGTPCGSVDHDHYGAKDSVQKQWENQVDFYATMRQHGVFVNAPDDYTFVGGANKDCGWYTEMQFSLPRWQHISISHQEIYDHTYFATPTQTWMFAPLVPYHSGGASAALEPFAQTGDAWEWTLASYLGAGVTACYRGDRLFDNDQTKAMVTKWMGFWNRYRAILVQDVIHVRRPDMQSIDVLLHVSANATDEIAAIAMLYNPALIPQSATVQLPLYYTGEGDAVTVSREEAAPAPATLARDYSLAVSVELKPLGVTYFVIRRNR